MNDKSLLDYMPESVPKDKRDIVDRLTTIAIFHGFEVNIEALAAALTVPAENNDHEQDGA